MVSNNPFAEFRIQCSALLEEALAAVFPEDSVQATFAFPPKREFGQLSSSICFELGKKLGEKPRKVAIQLTRKIKLDKKSLVQDVKEAGGGFVNFYANFDKFSTVTLHSVRTLKAEYGYVKTDVPENVIVEHTSVNPVSPIHIGQARNPVLGDCVARILKARGHDVQRHYYIDDVGRQIAVNDYGYKKLGSPQPDGKADHFFGRIYAITSCIIEIYRLKKDIERLGNIGEERMKVQRQLDDWMAVAAGLKDRFPQLFEELLGILSEVENPELQISILNREYEVGNDEEVKRLVRDMCQLCLEGLKETLFRIGVSFDSWDWESNIVWSGLVSEVLQNLKQSPYVTFSEGVSEFNADRVANDFELKRALSLNLDYEVPSLTLERADSTTLYTTRDVAYSLWKFERADKLINVIGMEQSLAQLQLKLILYALGYGKKAPHLVHLAYNLVRLPGYRMSGRRGRYITLDKVVDEAVERAYQEVTKRSPHLSDGDKQRISKFVGLGALRYALVEVAPSKPVVFTWDRVLNFEKNSAPYIQYSHARACSILRKAEKEADLSQVDYSLLNQQVEKDIILTLAKFPDIFIEAAENMKPNNIAEYANTLADKFNTFYNSVPVLKAESHRLKKSRLALVDAVKTVLGNALRLIGVEAPEKM